MKKKVLSLLMTAALAATLLAGCGNKAETPAADAPAATEEPAAADDAAADTAADVADAATDAAGDLSSANIAVFYYTYSDVYISTVRTNLDKVLTDMGVKFQDYDGNSNQTTQTEQVNTAITGGANVLIVNIVETSSDDAAKGIVDAASAKNIPVIFFNREVSDDVVKSYDNCVFVGTDAAEAGHMQGEMIGQFLVDNYDTVDLNGDGVISYVMFKGQEGNNEAIYRTQYSVEDANKVLEAAGKKPLQFYDANNKDLYLVDKNGSWSAAAANEYMTTILAEYSETNKNMIELVICNNDDMASGSVTALQSTGYNKGEGSTTIPVYGVDATDTAKELIGEGSMTGTIKQDAEGMANAIGLVTKNAAGGADIMAGTESLNVDESVNKIRVPYAMYTGE